MVVIGLIGDTIDFIEEHGLELDFGIVGGHGLEEEEVEHGVVDEEEVEHGVLVEVGLEQLVLDDEEVKH